MTDLQELRRLATDVLTIEKSGKQWKTGVPDHEEQLAKRHEIELAQAQIALRDALRNPSTIIELLDRLQAAEKELLTYRTGWDVINKHISRDDMADEFPDVLRRVIAEKERAEKVCRAEEALSLLYDGELDIYSPLLYETWREIDEALAEWKEAQ